MSHSRFADFHIEKFRCLAVHFFGDDFFSAVKVPEQVLEVLIHISSSGMKTKNMWFLHLITL
jgi:hypothetical protein